MKINEIINEDWNKVNKQDKTDGLSQKAVNAYRRENPGSKLKTAVTTKPSKLKPGSKAAKRRKSFCARMSGNKGPMKKPNGQPTPKALALRRWNCESIEDMRQLIENAERVINEEKQKGVDGKVCWKGYKRMGTKMKGGKRVDNCVKVSEADDANFTTDDLQQLQKMNNVDDVKRRAIELITTKSRKPMKPEKVAWFKRAIASKRTPMDVIKLMYDLMLSGDGQAVIGSRGSMASNSYRRTFGDDLEEAYINSSKDAIEILSNLRKIGKSIELGQGSYDGNLAGMYVNDVYDVVTWLSSNADTSDPKFKQIIVPVIELRKKAKGMEREPGSGKDARFGNEIVNTLYPLMQWIEMNAANSKETDEYSPPSDSNLSPMSITPEKPKTPLGEFILSYFDRETGKFPKGETAVLTAVEKDYGDEYVEPARQFIERVQTTTLEYKQQEAAQSRYPETEMIKTLAGI
jgi:hypothetical protein